PAGNVTDNGTGTVSPDGLVVGDTVLIRPGGRVPADGEVVTGTADVDESMITGESQPVARASGDHVVAGAVATGNAIRVRVSATGDQTAPGGTQRLVAPAPSPSRRAPPLAHPAAAWLVA